jgi:hypothetical protein
MASAACGKGRSEQIPGSRLEFFDPLLKRVVEAVEHVSSRRASASGSYRYGLDRYVYQPYAFGRIDDIFW